MSGRHRPRADAWGGECDDEVRAFLDEHGLHGLDPGAALAGVDAPVMLDRLEAVRRAACIADCSLDWLYRLRLALWTALEEAGVGRGEMAERSGVERNSIDQAFSAARRKAAKA